MANNNLELPNQRTLAPDQESAAARRLARERLGAAAGPEGGNRVGAAEALKRVAGNENQTQAITGGVSLGLDLRRQINETNFDSGTFHVVLLLSIIKDLANILTLGTFGTLLNFAVTPALFIIFFMRGSLIARTLIKWFVWPMVVEFIPFLDFFPMYVVMTLLLKYKMDKKRKELQQQLEETEKEMKKTPPNFDYENSLEPELE